MCLLTERPSRKLMDENMRTRETLFQDLGVWKKIWIVQELAFVPELLLQYGHGKLPWNNIAIFLDHRYYPDALHGPFLHQSYSQSVQLTVRNAPRHRFRCATDPRDKIYSLLGLVTDTLGIKPDKGTSVGDVYVEVTLAQIGASQNLDILAQSQWEFGRAL